MFKTIRNTIEQATLAESRDFGLVDRFGRKLGAAVWFGVEEFTPKAADAEGSYWNHAPGRFYSLDVQSTRNGVSYGASNRTRYFATEAERAAAVTKYFRETEKRAKKVAEKEAEKAAAKKAKAKA